MTGLKSYSTRCRHDWSEILFNKVPSWLWSHIVVFTSLMYSVRISNNVATSSLSLTFCRSVVSSGWFPIAKAKHQNIIEILSKCVIGECVLCMGLKYKVSAIQYLIFKIQSEYYSNGSNSSNLWKLHLRIPPLSGIPFESSGLHPFGAWAAHRPLTLISRFH
jgi:hypothetical protein